MAARPWTPSLDPPDAKTAGMAGALVDLPEDPWRLILSMDTSVAVCARRLSKTFCAIASQVGIEIKKPTGTCTQKQFCERLALTPAEAKTFPFVIKGVTRYCDVHVFDLAVCVPLVFDRLGAETIAKRLDKRDARRGKAVDLPTRRKDAAAARRAKLDAWMATDATMPSSTTAWTAGLRQRHIKPPAIVEKFLTESLTAPALKAVKQAIADHALRAQQLDAALATYALTRRDDSRLCEAFDAGEPIGGFDTAAKVAREMAFMHWLHNYTDYDATFEQELERVREEAGRFFPGIHAVARDYAKSEFTPPTAWPWL